MKIIKFLSCLIFSLSVISCSTIQNAVGNSLSGMNKKAVPKKGGDNSMMMPLVGEEDVDIVADFFPTILKMYEIVYAGNPDHGGMATMNAQLCVMYGNAFIQQKADMMTIEELDEQQRQIARAKMYYLRGREFGFKSFDSRYKNFSQDMLSGNEERINKALKNLKKSDVTTAYWCAGGWLSAFGLDPLNIEILSTLKAAVALMEKANELDPEYNNGSIWDALSIFYRAAPSDFGGDVEKAEICHAKAMELSKGKTPGVYVTYAQSFCIPDGNLDGFNEALDKALAINPDDDPSTRLATIISQNKARYLKAHAEDYFLIW